MAAVPTARELADRLAPADAVAGPIGRFWRALLPAGGTPKALLSGATIGHALHPILTDVPIGTWTSATLLDLLGGRDAESGAELLIGVGLAAALPTFWSGWSDWSDVEERNPEVRRIGIVHAVSNGTAAALYLASLRARRDGAVGRGKLLGLAGAAAMSAGGFLGGHIAHAKETAATAAPPA
jgi:uncharacterized membrane protein